MAIQDHIHIGAILDDETENAPDHRYIVTDWAPQDELTVSWERAWDGTPFWGIIEDDSGDPVAFENLRYTLKVTLAEYRTLQDLLGRKVYVVDVDHAADEASHTTYLRQMLFAEIQMDSYNNTLLDKLFVQVLFLDADTVAALQ
jgi:hypothetical protein